MTKLEGGGADPSANWNNFGGVAPGGEKNAIVGDKPIVQGGEVTKATVYDSLNKSEGNLNPEQATLDKLLSGQPIIEFKMDGKGISKEWFQANLSQMSLNMAGIQSTIDQADLATMMTSMQEMSDTANDTGAQIKKNAQKEIEKNAMSEKQKTESGQPSTQEKSVGESGGPNSAQLTDEEELQFKPQFQFSTYELSVDGGGPSQQITQVNMWLAPNMMVALTINLTEMAQMMKEGRVSELAATLESMNMVMEFALNAADLIRAAGVAESQMKMLEGTTGLMTAAGGVAVGTLAGIGSRGGGIGTFMGSMGGGQALSSVVSGTGQALSGFIGSGLTLKKSGAEAEKEIQETLKQLQSQVLQSSVESRKELGDLLTKAMDLLKSIAEQNANAHKSFMPHV